MKMLLLAATVLTLMSTPASADTPAACMRSWSSPECTAAVSARVRAMQDTMTVPASPPADCALAQQHLAWIEHYTDWKARLQAQGTPENMLTGMTQSIEKMQRAYAEASAKCGAK